MTEQNRIQMLNSEFCYFFIFVVVTNVKLKVVGGIEKTIGLQGNGICIFQKSIKTFKTTVWRPIDLWQNGVFRIFYINSIDSDSTFLC